jgi:hypothetical protein
MESFDEYLDRVMPSGLGEIKTSVDSDNCPEGAPLQSMLQMMIASWEAEERGELPYMWCDIIRMNSNWRNHPRAPDRTKKRQCTLAGDPIQELRKAGANSLPHGVVTISTWRIIWNPYWVDCLRRFCSLPEVLDPRATPGIEDGPDSGVPKSVRMLALSKRIWEAHPWVRDFVQSYQKFYAILRGRGPRAKHYVDLRIPAKEQEPAAAVPDPDFDVTPDPPSDWPPPQVDPLAAHPLSVWMGSFYTPIGLLNAGIPPDSPMATMFSGGRRMQDWTSLVKHTRLSDILTTLDATTDPAHLGDAAVVQGAHSRIALFNDQLLHNAADTDRCIALLAQITECVEEARHLLVRQTSDH